MILLDVNVVFAAHRVDHPHHATIRRWMDAVDARAERFVVPTIVWTSFLRLATSRRPFFVPTPLVEAFAFLEAVRAHPRHLPLEPGPQHLALLRRLCEESDATGDLVADAVIAAIALEHGCAVASLDRDFARFPSIDHVIPGAG
ncbi:MAG: PIN domain-containing protein [Actinomycetota bacterium]|nr:PIN domain-containing protein [Actinomycetota bacterium]